MVNAQTLQGHWEESRKLTRNGDNTGDDLRTILGRCRQISGFDPAKDGVARSTVKASTISANGASAVGHGRSGPLGLQQAESVQESSEDAMDRVRGLRRSAGHDPTACRVVAVQGRTCGRPLVGLLVKRN